MIEINQLQVVRSNRAICSVEHFSAAPGEHVAVVGSNGSGKTTLLRVLAGLIPDYGGNCQVNVGHQERTYVHQQPLMFRGTALNNVRYGQRHRAGQLPSANELFAQLGLEGLADRPAKKLSAGEIRRVALARALACNPSLLILDEPLADLDAAATSKVSQVLNGLAETTVVIASPVDLPEELRCRTFPMPQSTRT